MPDSRPQPPRFSLPLPAPADPAPLLLCGARLTDGRTVDVRLCGGRIEAVSTTGRLPTDPVGTRVDLRGYLLLPAPAEPHAHADTALSAGGALSGVAGEAGPEGVRGQAAPDRENSGIGGAEIRRRATEAALLQLGHGATALRSHVHIGGAHRLDALAAVLGARRSLCGLAELTTVAMPRRLTGVAGSDGLAILRDAVRMGATVVGGCPDADPDPTGYMEAVLGVASDFDCPVDLHTNAHDPARLARLAAMAGGLRPGVTLGPCGGLGRLPAKTAARVADALAAAGVSVVCLPQGGCGPADRRGTAPVRLLRSAGVRVTAGSGALRDVANPVGRGDPLEAAYLLASRHGLSAEEAYAMVSTSARTALGLPEVRVETGFPADLLAVRGDGLAGALSLAYSRVVIHRGRLVARTSAVREYCDSAGVAPALPRQGRARPS